MIGSTAGLLPALGALAHGSVEGPRPEVFEALGGLAFIAALAIFHLLATLGLLGLLAAAAGCSRTLLERAERLSASHPGRSLALGVGLLLVWVAAASLVGTTPVLPLRKLGGLGLLAFAAVAVLLGAAAGALRTGARVSALARPEPLRPLARLALGWTVLAYAALVPVVGWLLLGATLLEGAGAVLLGLFVPPSEHPPAPPADV